MLVSYFISFSGPEVALISQFCFFVQAEDGIRDRNVTGVQTCALPILVSDVEPIKKIVLDWAKGHADVEFGSEERRVGKELRSRWSPYHKKKKKKNHKRNTKKKTKKKINTKEKEK